MKNISINLEEYKKNAEEFLSSVDKEYYLHFSGLKPDLNVSEIYEKYSDLFTVKNFNDLMQLYNNAVKCGDEKQVKKLSYLLKFCGEGLLESEAKEIIDELGKVEAQTMIDIEGKKVPFRFSEILLSNEEDKQKRDLVDDKRNKITDDIFNPILKNYWQTLHSSVKKFGFNSYKDLLSFLKQEDFADLNLKMNYFLKQTDEIYEKHFGYILKKQLGIDLNSSRKSDFAFLRRARKYDDYFKKEKLVEIFKATLNNMGIDIENQSNIIFDIEERENKSPRAFCATVKIPLEIYLVVMPKGGQDDFEAILHEGGHALHFANTKESLDFEYKFLGDNAVTEGYAFCLEHLMQDKEWLKTFFNFSTEDAKEFVYFSNIIKLWYLRRYAGKLQYELILHDGSSLSGKDEKYKQILQMANLMQYSSSDYLKDVDEAFYCTNYIRAWIFEAQLKDYIYRKYDYNWFKKKKAGYFLIELFSYGQKYNPVEILKQLDYNDLDIDFLTSSIKEEIIKNK